MPDHNVTLDRVRAPYGFVPLAARVVVPPWGKGELPLQDVPFSDGISGTLDLRIEALGPLFTRDARDKERSYRDAKGNWALPSTSLRGMLRAVLEIATFAKMDRVNRHKPAVRDLQDGELYQPHMATTVPGSKHLLPLVSAGWLVRNDGPDDDEHPALLQPCSFAKVHYDHLYQIAKSRNIRGFEPATRQAAPAKYKAWGDDLDLDAEVEVLHAANPPGKPPRIGSYGRVLGKGNQRGRLVFTGQPSEWNPSDPRKKKAKHHDFFFYQEIGAPLRVSAEVWQDFLFVHSDGGQQHRLTEGANAELKHWLSKSRWEDTARTSGRIPVFFLLHPDGSLRAMGLAMMFRLPSTFSTWELAQLAQEGAEPGLDLARLIFGDVPLRKRSAGTAHEGVKGRVSIDEAKLVGEARELDAVRVALTAPRASYYPNYLEQDARAALTPDRAEVGGRPERHSSYQVEKYRYQTYMDRARPRGWKRYRVMKETVKPVLPHDRRGRVLENVLTSFRPIQPSPQAWFSSKVRIHNLQPVELGALLWAIELGGDEDANHTFGMARSFGYGRLRLRVSGHTLLRVVAHARGEPAKVDLDEARKAFAAFMEEALVGHPGGWAGSRQIVELRALVKPGPPERHMWIEHPEHGGNEFIMAKKQGLVLAPSVPDAEWRRSQQLPPLPLRESSQRAARSTPEPARGAPKSAFGRPAPVREVPRPPVAAPTPTRPPPPAAVTDETDERELRQAMIKGQQFEVARRWLVDGGVRREVRRHIARRVLGAPQAKHRTRHPDVVAWYWDEEG
jgi:CRISPR-associated protein (TIGR03986 family)